MGFENSTFGRARPAVCLFPDDFIKRESQAKAAVSSYRR